MKSVSILIPAYNAEAHIGECLASALAQTWPRKEIIVVDDGSSDGTAAEVRKLSPRGVSLITQANKGTSAARNTALRHATGDYLQWLDADDLLAPDKIERQMQVAQELADPSVLLSSSWSYFRAERWKRKWMPVRNSLCADLTPAEWLTRKMQDNAWMAIESWLVSRQLSEAAGPWDESLSADDDGEYFTRVLAQCSGTRFVEEAHSWVRRGEGLSSGIEWSNGKMDSQFRSIRQHVRILRSLALTERTRAASLRMLEGSLEWFYPARMDLVREAEQLAAELGGVIERPRRLRKSKVVGNIFGPEVARQLGKISNAGLDWTAAGAKFAGKARAKVARGAKRVARMWGKAETKRRLWNEEFASGQWNYLEDTPGDALYPILSQYARGGSILDLGCGSGNTASELAGDCFATYTGVDISDVAVERAQERAAKLGLADKVTYLQGDILDFEPASRYDVILFRESLFYVPKTKVVPMLKRYAQFLQAEGVFIVRMCDRRKYGALTALITSAFGVIEQRSFSDVSTIILVIR